MGGERQQWVYQEVHEMHELSSRIIPSGKVGDASGRPIAGSWTQAFKSILMMERENEQRNLSEPLNLNSIHRAICQRSRQHPEFQARDSQASGI